jgi:transposase
MQDNLNSQPTAGAAQAKPEIIKLGLDLHARQVTECRQLDGSTPKAPQQWEPQKLLAQVEAWVKAGIKVYSCYEAGACGYWFHRELVQRGAVNVVVAPRPLGPYRAKGQKTDRLDARGLLDLLDSYLRGNRQALSLVAVPSPELEQQRSVVRHREQLMRHRRRAEAQGRALALTQGIVAPVGWCRPAVWATFEPQLPQWLKPQLAYWQQTALALNGQERQVRSQLEQMVSQALPVGVGALSWITLQLEIRGWERFDNRRQIASYTGLCPGLHQSNGRGHEGSINHCGNPVVRYLLVEMVWRLLRWQPAYPPVQKLRQATSKRGRRRLAVAAARRLAIDLWRLATKRATPETLGLQMHLLPMTQSPPR